MKQEDVVKGVIRSVLPNGLASSAVIPSGFLLHYFSMTPVDSGRLERTRVDSIANRKYRETNPLSHNLRAVNGLQKQHSSGSNPCLTAISY